MTAHPPPCLLPFHGNSTHPSPLQFTYKHQCHVMTWQCSLTLTLTQLAQWCDNNSIPCCSPTNMNTVWWHNDDDAAMMTNTMHHVSRRMCWWRHGCRVTTTTTATVPPQVMPGFMLPQQWWRTNHVVASPPPQQHHCATTTSWLMMTLTWRWQHHATTTVTLPSPLHSPSSSSCNASSNNNVAMMINTIHTSRRMRWHWHHVTTATSPLSCLATPTATITWQQWPMPPCIMCPPWHTNTNTDAMSPHHHHHAPMTTTAQWHQWHHLCHWNNDDDNAVSLSPLLQQDDNDTMSPLLELLVLTRCKGNSKEMNQWGRTLTWCLILLQVDWGSYHSIVGVESLVFWIIRTQLKYIQSSICTSGWNYQ